MRVGTDRLDCPPGFRGRAARPDRAMSPPDLTHVEDRLPGATLEGRLRVAQRLGLALEIADGEDDRLERAVALGARVVTLQAYGMHELHPLHVEAAVRRAARRYVLRVIERAAAAKVARVLTCCGFGHALADRAFERCLEFYALLAPRARELGLRVLIEPLGPKRAGAMTDPAEVERLLHALEAPDVFGGALDSGHLLDGGRDPERELARWNAPLDELQLRGPDGGPPPRDVPLARWLAACRTRPEVVCVEHRSEQTEAELERLVAHLRDELATA